MGRGSRRELRSCSARPSAKRGQEKRRGLEEREVTLQTGRSGRGPREPLSSTSGPWRQHAGSCPGVGKEQVCPDLTRVVVFPSE